MTPRDEALYLLSTYFKSDALILSAELFGYWALSDPEINPETGQISPRIKPMKLWQKVRKDATTWHREGYTWLPADEEVSV